MSVLADRTAFLAGNDLRLQVAEWCRSEQLSREEIAKRAGRASGSMSAPDTMLGRGALVEVADESPKEGPRRARTLKLNPEWEQALENALGLKRPASLEAGSDLLLISLGSTEDACSVLAEYELDDIEWGTRLDGEQMGLMISPRRDMDSRSTIRAVAALERAG